MTNAAAVIDRTEEYQNAGIIKHGDIATEVPGEGLHIKRGAGSLFFAEDDLSIQKLAASDRENAERAAAGERRCDHCDEWFKPRTKTGGRPQKFCTEECRRAADAERKANAPQRDRRASGQTETDNAPELEPIGSFTGRIPPQDAIIVQSVNGLSALGHDVEILQNFDALGGEPSRIDIASGNVVRLARMMLWAAGFKHITIAHSDDGGGWTDLKDGDEPGNHY